MNRATLSVLPLIAVILAGCSDDKPVTEQPIRAIKSITVEQSHLMQSRRLSGVVSADVSSELSFQLPGRLVEFDLAQGDAIKKDQLIGRIDPAPYQLARDNAEERLKEQQANHAEVKAHFKRMQSVLAGGHISQSEFDGAEANLARAEAAVASASTQLALAERDLVNTTLTAPFSGQVTAIHVEQFNDIAAGQKIMQLTNNNAMSVSILVPEVMVNQIATGDPATIRLPGIADATFEGVIREINSATGAASTFDVAVSIDNPTPAVRPGMSAEVGLQFEAASAQHKIGLPTTAVLPTEAGERQALVYVYDPETSTVQPRAVSIVSVVDNTIEVVGELSPGDRVAVAGVSFLYDGMPVKLMETNQ